MRSIALPPLAVAAGLFTELGTLVTDVGQRRILRLPSWATPRSMLLYRARLEQAASSMHGPAWESSACCT